MALHKLGHVKKIYWAGIAMVGGLGVFWMSRVPDVPKNKVCDNEKQSTDQYPSRTSEPWRLLRKAKNVGDFKTIQELSSKSKSLNDAEARELAQSLDFPLAIKLATLHDSDVRLLLPPPHSHLLHRHGTVSSSSPVLLLPPSPPSYYSTPQSNHDI